MARTRASRAPTPPTACSRAACSSAGVRMVQLFHRGWDQHLNLDRELRAQSMDTDQPSAALVSDLARLGLLEDTLVVWGGGVRPHRLQPGQARRPRERPRSPRPLLHGLDGRRGHQAWHHPTAPPDDWSYNVAEGGVHVNDLNATILHQLGIDHERFTYPYLGLDQRLTGVGGVAGGAGDPGVAPGSGPPARGQEFQRGSAWFDAGAPGSARRHRVHCGSTVFTAAAPC